MKSNRVKAQKKNVKPKKEDVFTFDQFANRIEKIEAGNPVTKKHELQ